MIRFLCILMCGIVMFFSYNSISYARLGDLMETYLWEKRVILIFTPNLENKKFKQQNIFLSEDIKGLKERDLIIWEIIGDSFSRVNKAIAPHLPARYFSEYFRTGLDEFSVILVGKDGTEKLRQNQPVSIKTLFALIDAMPMRQREMRGRQ